MAVAKRTPRAASASSVGVAARRVAVAADPVGAQGVDGHEQYVGPRGGGRRLAGALAGDEQRGPEQQAHGDLGRVRRVWTPWLIGARGSLPKEVTKAQPSSKKKRIDRNKEKD